MLLVGMDVSGDPDKSNYNYLGIVLGTPEGIVSLSRKIGPFPEHMSKIQDDRVRNEIRHRLNFNHKTTTAFCVKLDRKRIIDNIIQRRKIRKKRSKRKSVYNTYNRVLMQLLQKKIEYFVISHDLSFTEIDIQCDNDCVAFVKAASLKRSNIGAAYRISDYVAWFNNTNDNPDSVFELDFVDEMETKIHKILKLD